MPCELIYVGSIQSPVARFSSHKSSANSVKSKPTGLAENSMNGCPYDPGGQLARKAKGDAQLRVGRW